MRSAWINSLFNSMGRALQKLIKPDIMNKFPLSSGTGIFRMVLTTANPPIPTVRQTNRVRIHVHITFLHDLVTLNWAFPVMFSNYAFSISSTHPSSLLPFSSIYILYIVSTYDTLSVCNYSCYPSHMNAFSIESVLLRTDNHDFPIMHCTLYSA